ncbi:MAG: type II secretion system minor pseudopilin GspK [Gammaproteobacteria bacterium]|nr:type II secretion system minor pseudopilin GspK [Gammaproteobacteria bacterium]
MHSLARSQGVALITVLLVVALATIATTAMVSRQQMDIRLTQARLLLEQARHIALAGEGLGRVLLSQDRKKNKTDDLSEDWAMSTPPLPIDSAQIMGCVIDQNSRFNLNNLITAQGKLNPAASGQLQRLLQLLELDPALANAIEDWLDADINPSGSGGAEDDFYSSLPQAYRSANRALLDLSELRAVRGITPEIFNTLEPYLTALPSVTKINVNTASELNLQALHNKITPTAAKTLLDQRPTANSALPEANSPVDNGTSQDAFQNIDNFIQQLVSSGVSLTASDKSQIRQSADVSSDYFQTRVIVTLGAAHYILYSLLYRDNTGATRVLQRARREQLGQTICNPF